MHQESVMYLTISLSCFHTGNSHKCNKQNGTLIFRAYARALRRVHRRVIWHVLLGAAIAFDIINRFLPTPLFVAARISRLHITD